MSTNCLPRLLPQLRWLQVFGCIGSETRLEKLGARSIAVASFATAAWGGASGHLECEAANETAATEWPKNAVPALPPNRQGAHTCSRAAASRLWPADHAFGPRGYGFPGLGHANSAAGCRGSA